ncbi:MAG TPA: ABC transporter ATP-binding protein [Gaiellaceae bacterium]|nr:ABC transporter ATP-binding protein [Gaiellaceae bacterium]
MAEVRWDGVTKRFGEVEALSELHLQAAEGEFLVLVGPSGSGKTTALRLLAGLEGVTGGHIYIGDARVDNVPPRQRQIAMVFQDYALYPQMTVERNLAFGLRIAGLPKPEIRVRVDEAAEILGLSDLLKRKPRELSGGQRQRVALGRALVRRAQALLMDEPLSNLDAQLRAQMRSEIKRLHSQLPTTTVYVTHDQVEAMTMGDRIAVMEGGRLRQVDAPATIYEQPANIFVAGFIGSPAMALNTVGVASTNDGAVLSRGETTFAVGPAALPREVVLGVRPEHCRPWADGAKLHGPFEGGVVAFEALGRESFVTVETAAGCRFTVGCEGTAGVGIGDRFRFGVSHGWLYVFDPASGESLGRH